ncbi:hypothetical protein ACYFX5_09065 [Bremerella sp. T1]|uniref:hypothetical protein n=1 Tax=Bremerella sp. TYQ1 TaxID=3119568 RepID=UPI001CCDCB0B|nr:hypothetical protein [Bremerella volcania]UBM38402.1 hypothetical protein LA756_10995 [Bremerella volcania]
MAGEWMQIDIDIMEKPEFLRIIEITGETDEVVLFRLVRLWAWIERATTDGIFPGLTIDTLARKFGGDREFWEALADPAVDWLWIHPEGLQIPRYEKRFDKSAKRRAQDAKSKAKKRQASADKAKPVKHRIASATCRQNDDQENSENKNNNLTGQSISEPARTPSKQKQPAAAVPPDHSDQVKAKEGEKAQGELFTEVELARVVDVAEELFRQANYSGDDGGIFYKAAAILEANPGPLTRHKLTDAARGCRGSANPPGYFRQSMRNICPDFDDRALGVWIEPRWPKEPPNKIPRKRRAELQLRGVPKGSAAGHDPEQRRDEVLAQLAEVGT